MPQINILEQQSIDQIAAGEVVERPASVVKELVENAIDALATAITVEIKEGGIALIRVTDNGGGIEKEQIAKAFIRHATSKIRSAADLNNLHSLGFRGEALSSIAAVSEMEVISKTPSALTGVRYTQKGGGAAHLEEIGAPEGTTFLVRHLFYNVPVRKKFLKQAATESSYIVDLMEHIALSRPDIAFKFVNNGQVRFHTSGRDDLLEVIFRIYGRDVVDHLLPITFNHSSGLIRMSGFLGRPELNRANRNFEVFFVNNRFIKSELLSRGLEEGCRPFLMQHKFPFAIIMLTMGTELVDVNVHPTKMEVRFADDKEMFAFITAGVRQSFAGAELIVSTNPVNKSKTQVSAQAVPEPFEVRRLKSAAGPSEEEKKPVAKITKAGADIVVAEEPEYKLSPHFEKVAAAPQNMQDMPPNMQENPPQMMANLQNSGLARVLGTPADTPVRRQNEAANNIIKAEEHILVERPLQMNFFEDKFLAADRQAQYQVLGQVFLTYWLVALDERLIFIDQHAAHEKVKYERLLKELSDQTPASQMLSPPVIVSLNGREEGLLTEHLEAFKTLGFELENFGESTYALRGVPVNLYGCHEAELFRELLDELGKNGDKERGFKVIEHRIAAAACKAAVKGNHSMNGEELKVLIDELLTLENPYFCPHGRPTMIAMTRSDLEKKFKRIV